MTRPLRADTGSTRRTTGRRLFGVRAAVIVAALAVLTSSAAGGALRADAAPAAGVTPPSAITFLALPVSGDTVEDVALLLADLGVRRVRVIPRLGFWVLEPGTDGATSVPGPEEAGSAALLGRLRASGLFEWVFPAGTRRLAYLPNDEFFGQQWGPTAVGLPQAWDISTGAAGVTIAVLDSGLDPEIPDLAGRVVRPYSALADDSDPASWLDTSGHGSGTAAVAAASGDDGAGIAGAAWGVGVMPVKIGEGGSIEIADEIAGLVWAADHGASVLNLSFGSTETSVPEETAVRWALDQGAVLVAAAGNGGTEFGVEYPAGYAGVVAVGSVGRGGEWSSFSGAGNALDLVAPGEGVLTWSLRAWDWELTDLRGTSFAAPLVAGVAALMLSVNPALGPADVEYILTRTADDRGPAGWDFRYGWGILDADEAVAVAATWDAVDFPDVPAYHTYSSAVTPLAAAGVISGFADGTFRPQQRVMRQQFAKMVLLALGWTPTEAMMSPFLDVERSATGLYPDHYVAMAAQLGITTGTSVDPPLFDPYGSITRAQMVTMAVRAVDATMPGGLSRPPSRYLPPFGSFSAVHDPAAARAGWNGMLDGLDGLGAGYDMWAPASRGEVASVLAWAYERRLGLR